MSSSFESAGSYPYKLLYHAKEYMNQGAFSPTHIFVYPTYSCNLKCEYCCCGDEDRKTTPMMLYSFRHILHLTKPRAVTFAGGGEPTLHPQIEQLVDHAVAKGVPVGIMTNGKKMGDFSKEFWNKFAWVRISMDASREEIPFVEHPRLSYIWVGESGYWLNTLTSMENAGEIASLRIMGDIHNDQQFERGAKKCYMPLVRSVFAPDGSVYACCRAHYAFKDGGRRLPKRLRVAENVVDYMENVKGPIDGSACDRCFYGSFNRLMARIEGAMDIEDVEFI